MQTVFLLATLQAAFLVALLLSKRHRQLPDLMLAAWLTVIGLHTLVYYLSARLGVGDSRVLVLSSGVPFLQGPFLYFYVDSLTAPRARPRPSYAWHLIPFLVFVGPQLLGWGPFGIPSHSGSRTVHLFDLSLTSNVLLLLSVPVYTVWSLVLLRRFRRRVLDNFSTIDRINLGWLRFIVTGMGLIWTCVIIAFAVRKATGGALPVGHLLLGPVALFVYAIGFFGFKQTTVFSSVLLPEEEPSPSITGTAEVTHEPPSEPRPKYRKSGLSADQAEQTLERLQHLMETDRPYLDDQLTLPKVAAELGVSANHLSQVINSGCGHNFHDFVNRYRVAAVKHRLEDRANDDIPLLHIALECGFGSKSSFNRIFKDVTGQTPSRFRRGLGR